MKKFILSFIVLFSFLSAWSQQDTTDQQFVGKYKFAEGNPVTEVIISLENGVLSAGSALGTSELKKTAKDTYEIVSFGGTATFKRNTEGKVNGISIAVQDLTMEGTKSEDKIAMLFEKSGLLIY
jgi:hypothetical protein